MEPAKPAKRFHYAWVIFAVCFLMVFITLGFNSSPKSLFLAAVTEDMGISRSAFSISDSCRYISTAVINLFFGTLIAKFGPRKLAGAGFVCLILFNVLNSFARSVWMFYLGGILLGIGLAWTTTALVGCVVENWFTSSKGTVMGFILAANGLGGALSVQILSPIIYAGSDTWRKAYRVSAVIVAVAGFIILTLLRNRPEDRGDTPLGTGGHATNKRKGRDWVGIDAHDAFRKPYFYFCAIGVFLTGVILQSVTGVSSAHMRDRGLSPEVVAAAMSIGSLCLTAAKMFTGFTFDRFGLRVSMGICSVCAVSCIFLLAFVSNAPMAWVYQVLAAFGLPLETIMLPLISTELFGHKSYAFLMGLMLSFNTLGYAVGAPIMNWFFDRTGTYTNVMVVMACMMIAVAILMQLVISAAHKVRAEIEQQAN